MSVLMFRNKILLTGFIINNKQISITNRLNKSGYRARHSHSVFMVIDAMRFDFALQNDSMKYFYKLMKNEDACLFHLKVQPPTVTLPRIKVKSYILMKQ